MHPLRGGNFFSLKQILLKICQHCSIFESWEVNVIDENSHENYKTSPNIEVVRKM